MTIGLENPEDYANLPLLHNGFSTRYVTRALPGVLFFVCALIIGLYLLTTRGIMRIAAIGVVLLAALAISDTLPLRSSPYTPYMGNQGIAPYQHFIDHVNAIGGLTFWNYPETRSGVRPYGPIHLSTPPYPEVLEQAINYTGFAAIYGDNITVTKPGHEWDRVLTAYCRGRRDRQQLRHRNRHDDLDHRGNAETYHTALAGRTECRIAGDRRRSGSLSGKRRIHDL